MKKVTAIILSIIFLASNAGISLSTHYCGGKIYQAKIGLLNYHSLNCGMTPIGNADCESSPNSFSRKCCNNHVEQIKVDDSYNLSNVKINFDSRLYFNSGYSLSLITFVETDTFSKFQLFKPPLPKNDIPVINQSFLI